MLIIHWGLVEGFSVLFPGVVPTITCHIRNTIVRAVLCSAQLERKGTGLPAMERQLSEFLFSSYQKDFCLNWTLVGEKKRKPFRNAAQIKKKNMAAILMEKKCALASAREWTGCSVIRKCSLHCRGIIKAEVCLLKSCSNACFNTPTRGPQWFFLSLQEG